MHLALYSFLLSSGPRCLSSRPVMDQKECHVSPCRKLRIFRSCSSSQVVDMFLLWCEGRFPWSCCSADHRDSPVAPVQVVDAPGLLIVLVSLSWRRGGLPWSRPVLDQSVSRDARHGGRCPCCTGRAVHPIVAQRLCLTVQTVVGSRDSPVA